MAEVSIRAPEPTVSNEKVDYSTWTNLMSRIKAIDFSKDVNNLKTFLRNVTNGGSTGKPELHLGETKNLIVKKGLPANIDVKRDKSHLITLNRSVREITEKFDKDARGISEINKQLTGHLNRAKNDDTQLKTLRDVLGQLKVLAKTHNDLMSTPLMTLKALSTAVKGGSKKE